MINKASFVAVSSESNVNLSIDNKVILNRMAQCAPKRHRMIKFMSAV